MVGDLRKNRYSAKFCTLALQSYRQSAGASAVELSCEASGRRREASAEKWKAGGRQAEGGRPVSNAWRVT